MGGRCLEETQVYLPEVEGAWRALGRCAENMQSLPGGISYTLTPATENGGKGLAVDCRKCSVVTSQFPSVFIGLKTSATFGCLLSFVLGSLLIWFPLGFNQTIW